MRVKVGDALEHGPRFEDEAGCGGGMSCGTEGARGGRAHTGRVILERSMPIRSWPTRARSTVEYGWVSWCSEVPRRRSARFAKPCKAKAVLMD